MTEREHDPGAEREEAQSERRRAPAAKGLAGIASAVGNAAFGRLARQGSGLLPGGAVHPEVEQAINSRRGGGRPLDASTRERVSEQLGDPLADVRVHDDAAAGELARAVSARAFTTGADVYFAAASIGPGRPTATSCSRTSSPTWCNSGALPRRGRCRYPSRVTRSRSRRRRRRVISPAASPPRLDWPEVGRRIRAAVAGVAATEADPLDPYRGLYISDADALADGGRGRGRRGRRRAGGGRRAAAARAARRRAARLLRSRRSWMRATAG